ncbi:MAG: protein translocase subunit SecDF [Bacteroidales bacterium]|jgi:SecD/SecF fusion protein|nr:protein translocase subunit SecDF [Bacteroidales bacterium]
MQNKGAIVFLAITLALVSLYQLSFTAATYKVKKDARIYANGDLSRELNYIDSIASLTKEEWNYLGFTFRECQAKEINLGLDLKGGMNVILEIAEEDVVMALSNNSSDRNFIEALRIAKERRKESQAEFLVLFQRAFEELDPNARLAAIFATPELKEKVNFNTTNEEVIRVIEAESQVAIDNGFNILRTRIDRFGVVQPNISRLEGRGRILIELPGVKDPQRVRDLLQGTASLEFWVTYENSEILPFLSQANDALREIIKVQQSQSSQAAADTPSGGVAQADTAAVTGTESLLDLIARESTDTTASGTLQEFSQQNPLFSVLRPNVSEDGRSFEGSVIGLAHYRDTAKVNRYLAMNQLRAIFPRDLKFFWSHDPFKYDDAKTFYELHAIRVTTRNGLAPLDGSVITSARPSTGITGSDIKVDMSMNSEGAKEWALITGNNIGKCIAVVLDGYVRSAPRVSTEIRGGNSEISGDFTLEEAEDLANILKSGKLPAPARIVQDTVVGPSLGKEAISAGLKSFLLAFLVVLAYMVFYYSHRGGLVADIALLSNMFFMMGVLASLNAVLTLPGIAGIVLTLGMAVDANVLIYERIKEELRAGKGVKLAVADGYRNAYSAIIDGNVTTLLTGVVLYVFGTGPIKGFATTLVIGIITSLFSAIFITRIIYDTMLKRNSTLTFSIKATENFLKNTRINFIGLRKTFYVVSAIIFILSIASLFTRGLSQGIDFTGGRTFIVKFDQPVATTEVASALGEVFESNPQVVTYGSDNQVKIMTKYKVDEPGIDSEVEELLYRGLTDLLPAGLSMEEFLEDYRVGSETVGPTIALDIKIKALWAVGISLLVMFFYIFARFRNWQFGLGAIASLVHDTIVVLGIYSIAYGFLPFSLDIDQSFIAAILTVIGYSVNDTVIVFDRIREYRGLYRKRPLSEVMNMALNSTLSRTLNTSFTTLIVLFAIFIFGGEVIRGFIFALLIGIGVGTYSSLFVATPIVYNTLGKRELLIREKEGEKEKK